MFSCIREVVIGGTSGESFCVDGLLLVFFDFQHFVTLMRVVCIASSLDDAYFPVRLSLVGLAWSPDFVISSSAVGYTVREGFGAFCLVFG